MGNASHPIRLNRLILKAVLLAFAFGLVFIGARFNDEYAHASQFEAHRIDEARSRLRLLAAVWPTDALESGDTKIKAALQADRDVLALWFIDANGSAELLSERPVPTLLEGNSEIALADGARFAEPAFSFAGIAAIDLPLAAVVEQAVGTGKLRMLLDQGPVRARWVAATRSAMLVFLISAPLFVLCMLGITRTPVRNLDEAVAFAQGLANHANLRLSEKSSGVAEIDALRAALNHASDALQSQTASLAANEYKFRAAIDELQEAVFQIDLDLDWSFLSAGWERLTGYAASPCLGQRFTRHFAASDRELLDAGVRRMMTGRLVEFQEQVHLVNARGDALPVEFVARPFADGSAHCMGVTGSVTLLDSRRELERALMAQRRRLQEVVDSLPMSIALKTAEGEIVMANARAAVLYGRPLSHLVGVRERELFEARHVLSNPDRETRALSQRAQIIEEETEVVEGSRRTSLAGTVPIEDGARTLVLAFALDITDRKRVEEELRRQREFVSLVLDSDPNCIFVKDNERRYVMVNRAWNSFTGLPASAVIGRRIEEIFDDPGEVGQMLAAERRVIETQATDVQEEWARGGDGQVRWFRVLRKPMVTVDGRLFILVISNDVTEQRRYEEQLVTARQRAEDASRAKSEFLANVSHEIRTPMNGILGMSDLMLATRLDDQQRQYMNLARSSAGALMAVIDELLDFSKIEAGKLIIEQVSFPLHTLISDAVKPFALQAFDKGVTLEMRVSPDLPLFLMGDPVRLRQVLVNLVGNAVKFTERGEVVVEAVLAPFDPNASLSAPMAVHFSIRDTGIGIAPDKLSTIFQPFTQADGSTTRRYGGTGLGLTISSRLVELMGGQIEVRSAPGQGSSFSFALQYTYDSVHGRESLARLDFETHRVLWVAPSGVQNEWFVSVLRGWKADVGIARNCDEALNAVSRRAADVVFIDEHALDEQAERLIDSVRTKAPAALIVVMTAPREELKGARAAMLTRAAGSALRRLSKPVALLELQSTFEEVRRSEHSRAPSATEELGAPGRKLAILLVEDNPINQIVALNQIEQLGHEVALAENGRDALAQIESARFDVVLMDVQMPIMDGLEATAELRVREQRKGSARMPVIAVTAHAMRGDRERCLAAGMDGYISKPFQQSSLVAEVDRVLAGAQAAESGMEPAHASSFNLDAALAALNHDHALLRQVASLFIRTYPDLRARTGSARDARDGALLRRMAHEIKGMGLNLGAVELGRVASETEAASTRGDLDAATRSADAMLRELVRVERVMREIATQTARSNG